MDNKLNKIIQNNKDSYQNWRALLDEDDAKIQLLYSITPLINFSFLEIKKSIDEYYKIRDLISENFIKDTVLSFFKQEIGVIILRALITELHNAKMNGILKRKTSKERFIEFIEIISNVEAIEIILTKYSSLQILILANIEQFIHELTLFFSRLNNDFHAIENKFNLKELSTYRLHKIEFTGDKHRHGKRVIIANFSKSGSEKYLVYKPRCLNLVNSLKKIFLWINSNTDFDFKLPQTIFRDHYGWQSFVQASSCHNKQDVAYFFQNLGGLLCMFHLLNSQDIHSENIIANGKHPILVDCECLLTPVLLQDRNKTPRIRNLVCSSLVLPIRNMSNNQYSGFDNSVIGNTHEQLLPFSTLSWDKENTDEMILKRVSGKLFPHKSRPYLNSGPINPAEFQDHFLDGFNKLYKFFFTRKNELIDDHKSPLNYFNNCFSRVIIRPTNQYAKLLIESYHPALLNCKEKRDSHFSFLEKSIMLTPEYKHFIKSELASLNESNIPIFYANSSNRKIYNCDENEIEVNSVISPIDHVKYNLKKFWGDDDLKIQNTIIKNSFATLNYSGCKNKSQTSRKSLGLNSKSHSNKKLKQTILTTCNLIYSNKIQDGMYTSWPCIIPAGNKVTHSITDNSLYNGNLGIIYALGVCGYLYDIPTYKKLVCSYSNFLLSESERSASLFNTIGLYDGLGGIIYFLYYFSKIMPIIDTKFINRILQNFDKLVFERHKYDIMSGYSGLLLSLIKAHKFIETSVLTKYLNHCKNELLALLNNPTSDILLASYAHGITGVYYALYKLYEFTGDKNLINHIKKCVSIEKNLYDKKSACWNDARNFNIAKSNSAWCHGSVGIGLVRLSLGKKFKAFDDENDDFINAAINATLAHGFQTDSCLCHGYAGSLDFLLEVKLNNPSLLENKADHDYSYDFIKQIDNKALYFYKMKETFVPGLFDGLSGVVYLLLRLVFKSKIPSILMV